MSKKNSLRLLLVVGMLGASSSLVAYSACAVKHQVGSAKVGEATFTKLSHEGYIVKAPGGKLDVLEGYIIKGNEAVWDESARLMAVPASYGAGQMVALNPDFEAAKKIAPKKPAPKKPVPKKPTPKKPKPKKPACPT